MMYKTFSVMLNSLSIMRGLRWLTEEFWVLILDQKLQVMG